MFGSYSGIPQKPTEDVMYRIRGTIQDFLIRNVTSNICLNVLSTHLKGKFTGHS